MNRKRVPLAQPSTQGKREKKKLDKIRRIKQAAADLFAKKGFDAATTHDIARRARVGKGTLFLYARDKRDLVFLIFHDEIRRTSKRVFAQAKPGMPLLEQLVSVGTAMYRGFSRNIPLSRILLAELFFYRGKLAKEFHEDRERVIEGYERLLSEAQASGKLRSDVDPKLAAKHTFILIGGALRIWLDDEKPILTQGVAELRELLGASLLGLSATSVALGPIGTPPRPPGEDARRVGRSGPARLRTGHRTARGGRMGAGKALEDRSVQMAGRGSAPNISAGSRYTGPARIGAHLP
jgi:AcrR family transcriptional regulator